MVLGEKMSEIKEIRILPMSNKDPCCFTLEKAIEFLSNKINNEKLCKYFFKTKFNFIGNTLILFQYEGALIAKANFTNIVEEKIEDYNGYFVIDKDSIVIFNKKINIDELNQYVTVKSFNQSKQRIDLNYLDKINEMVHDYSSEDISDMKNQIWSMNVSRKTEWDNTWNLFKKSSCISIDQWIENDSIDYGSFNTLPELESYLKDRTHEGSIEAGFINRFVNKIKIGDIVIVHKGRSLLSGIGVVKSNYIFKNDSLKHFREIEWIYTPDNMELKKGAFFKTSNIVRLDEEYSRFVNEIFARIAGHDENVRKNLFNFIFKEYYNNYFISDKGIEHYNEYDIEKEHVRKYWKIMDEKASNNEYFADIIWDNIFQRDLGVLRVGSKNLRNMNQNKYGFSDDEMNQSAELFYNTVNSLLDTSSIDEQKRIINEYSSNKLSKGLGSGRFTPILYYLNDSFYPINSKSVSTFKFISLALGEENEISNNLNEYIDSNIKYKQLLDNLTNEFSCDNFDIGDVKVFDEFCHWICSVDDYLWAKNPKILPITIINNVPIFNDIKENGRDKVIFQSDKKRNLIYFGAPGTGKSYNLNQDKDELLDDFKENYERVTFHPDYSYANFVGTYKPVAKGESISYEYVPGPFMRSLVKALKNPSEPFLLIIEEINRANVAAVFGDVFQLLDRDSNNESRYPIETTEDMRGYLKKKLKQDFDKIMIPSNMFIWATMNSADQGVFPMDTAFKRRWDFKYFGINYNDEMVSNIEVELNGLIISWNELRKAINEELLSYRINEDKLLGPFFAFNEYLDSEIPFEEFMDTFKSKIIMYLFEDAARSKRNDLFSGISKNTNLTYSEICDAFDKNGVEIFCDNIKEKFINEDE